MSKDYGFREDETFPGTQMLSPKYEKEFFFTQILFSECIMEMDHHECTMGGGGGVI
jgi:hypothetical protein